MTEYQESQESQEEAEETEETEETTEAVEESSEKEKSSEQAEEALNVMKISELSPFERNLQVTFVVIEKGESRNIVSKKTNEEHSLADIKVGDETGCIICTKILHKFLARDTSRTTGRADSSG